jgi:hypothetical protein
MDKKKTKITEQKAAGGSVGTGGRVFIAEGSKMLLESRPAAVTLASKPTARSMTKRAMPS